MGCGAVGSYPRHLGGSFGLGAWDVIGPCAWGHGVTHCGLVGLESRHWICEAAWYQLDGVDLMAGGDREGVHLMARDACAQLTISPLHLTTLATTVVR